VCLVLEALPADGSTGMQTIGSDGAAALDRFSCHGSEHFAV